MKVALNVGRIVAQKDEYAHMKDGRTFSEDEPDFSESREKKALVSHFKRFTVDGTIRGAAGGAPFPFEIIISLRGNLVTFTAPDKKGPFRAYHVFYAFEKEVSKWSVLSERAGNSHSRAGSGLDTPLRRVEDEPLADRITCTTFNGFWLADVLHHLRDRGEFAVEGESHLLRKSGGT
jgi:hypothetical protein